METRKPRRVVVVWIVVVTIHTAIAAFAVGASALNTYLALPSRACTLSVLAVPQSFNVASAVVFGAIGVWHIHGLLRIADATITKRRLCFTRSGRMPTKDGPAINAVGLISSRLAILTRPFTAHTNGNDRSIRALSFDWRFTLREIVEIAMQTYQAYAISWTVTRPWINQLAVGSIVLNCMLTPLLSVVLRHHEDSRRFYCVVLDLVLDFSCSIIVPFLIVYPYIVEYDSHVQGYRNELFYDDVWRANAFVEGRQVLITSIFDAISTIFPHVSLLHCLNSVKEMHHEEHDVAATGILSESVHVKAVCPAPQASKTPRKPLTVKSKRGSRRLLSLVHVALVGWGASVVMVHYQANAPDDISAMTSYCAVRPRAWFAELMPCTVVFLNCARANTAGRADDLTTILNLIDRQSLASLVLMHCPELEVPSILTEFAVVRNIDIYNSTLVSWSTEAAVTGYHHPMLDRVVFVRTNVSTIPEGILHSNIPRSLLRVAFVSTNLTRLPLGMETHWADHPFTFLTFERSHLVSDGVENLAAVKAKYLQLPGNNLRKIPASLLSNSRFLYLVLSDNPLQELPSDGAVNNPGFHALLIERTNVSVVPPWLTEYHARGRTDVKFSQSPVCTNDVSSSPASMCLPFVLTDFLTYPMPVVEQFRAM